MTQEQLVCEFNKKKVDISRYHVKQMLIKRGFKKRKLLRMKAIGENEQRNEQFEKINHCREQFALQGMPILSIDTKKKELLGDFSRKGTAYSTQARHANDHDFSSVAKGQIVPHGIYDVSNNTGYITLGTSKDTSEFVCENIEKCWLEHLQFIYPESHTILILCDGGGSNCATHYIVKQDLVKLAKRLSINILVCHYPPYCSKWNPIEHRLFSQVSNTWSGKSLTDIQYVKELTDTTSTKTGLKVTTMLNDKNYLTKRDVELNFKENMNQYILFDDELPKWNYLIKHN